MLSRKHRENGVKSLSPGDQSRSAGNTTAKLEAKAVEPSVTTTKGPSTHSTSGQPDAEDVDDEDEKSHATSPTHCLFCSRISSSLEDNLTHMSGEHSFFIPDAEYLVDLTGLISYLGEKIAVGNVCIYCNDKGREFRTLDAVRKHMVDKSHCKIAYDTERDMLEISDYYDFLSSYPDAEERRRRKEERRAEKKARAKAAAEAAEGWEDVEDSGGEVDEMLDEPPPPPSSSSSSGEDEGEEEEEEEEDSSDAESLPENQVTFGDSHLELVLPSGNRLGHRTLRRYYAQSFPGRASRGADGANDPNSGRSIVRRLLADKHSALVPRRGGFGAFGAGTEVVKARNRGEAREAGRHIREFRDQKRKEDYRTRVAFVHNHQKHYRDPLLQVSSRAFLVINDVLSSSLARTISLLVMYVII